MNLCRACGSDFTGVRLFDAHRTGTHAYTFSEGMAFDPPVQTGRRCLDPDEMAEKGWAQDDNGRWFDPAKAKAVRAYFEDAA